MKKSNLNLLGTSIALSLVTSTLLHATNGDSLIGLGAKARGMGGVGIAVAHGAESGLVNPALITTVKGTEISFGGTVFMPEIKTQLNTNPMAPLPPQNKMTSDADLNLIPEVSLASKITENFYVGVGMWGTGGMGTDYSQGPGINQTIMQGQFSNFDMVTNLQMMQFAVPLAYKTEGLSIAIAPIIMYGNLDISYTLPAPFSPPPYPTVGAGLAQDFGFGVNLGVIYDFSNGLTAGAVYKSKIDMEYTNQLSTATQPFGIILPDGDHLEQPAEFGVGIAYSMEGHTFAFDYKKIQWSDAKGYKDFQWEDQNIYAFGYEYAQDNWALRLGYNYASSAVVETLNPAMNMFNLLGFPATEEQHYTVGGSYTFNDQFSLDLAYVYAAKNTETFDVSQLNMGLDSVTTDHSENSISIQLSYNF
ncbi:aromatic hydrocarbon degradation protein [Sulfurovum lithotrophicum]|uniref:Aromatic hydrocarbon degradation protein n=1 Tax=Sulfurovum lithotrophicum TaxID=206403 RepID=A0A7U4M0M3_9BACT|nr:outer membrane protein transport protein [Sulfurovum lithotrophicum]AKF24676.1 aromatic hydrocarbon degradation protein [Sulfurovum lithotrophicum]